MDISIDVILKTLILMLIFYSGILIVSSIYYYDYLIKKWKRISFIVYGIFVSLIIGGMFLVSLPLFGSICIYMESKIPLFGAIASYMILYSPLIVYSIREQRRFKCKKEEVAKYNGLEYIICYSDVVNAWYSRKTGKYYISNKLYEVLSSSERLAILYHEEGHAYNKFTNNLSLIISYAWYFIVASIIIFITFAWFESPNALAFLTIATLLVPLIPSVTLIAMTWSWINEHESDINAKRRIGEDAIVRALIKTYIYAVLHSWKSSNYVKNVEFKEFTTNFDENRLSFIKVTLTLAKYSWNAPLWFIDFIKKPIYITHPPLEYRIIKIIGS